ncbi:MAG: LysR family transcriptional regulator [Sporolactobacillus sp.]|nr:LysR family transcriptional regulator [Sporolactobacillus sp.]MCI1881586.1 LysR family transcriptional regulator [Sporolactobacillus sp.]
MFTFLNSFVVVYEERSFSLAGEKLYISQPTVTMHIQKLEKELGVQLFLRSGRQDIQPTESAHLLYKRCKRLFSFWSDSVRDVRQLSGQSKRVCKIGASNTIAVHMLPTVLRELHDAYPLTDFQIYMYNSDDVLKNVQAENVQLGFIETSKAADGIERLPFFNDELVRAGNLQEPLWLIREAGAGLREFTLRYLNEHNIVPRQWIVLSNNDMILSALRSGIGQSIVSKQTVGQLPHRSAVPALYRRFFMIRQATINDFTRKIGDTLLTLLREKFLAND